MKKVNLCFIILLITLSVSGQAYHPLIRTNAYWDVAAYNSSAMCYLQINRTEFLDRDSLIDGHYYRVQYRYPFIGHPGPGGTICPPYFVDTIPILEALLREDTSARKVYIYDEDSDPHDQLLYDFSLSKGDTFFTNYCWFWGVVDTVYDILLPDGETRKFFSLDEYGQTYYIEGVGGWQGLSSPMCEYSKGSGWTFLCLQENGIPLWGNDCGYVFVGNAESNSPKINIYPNPCHENLSIEYPNNPGTCEIGLYDLYGQLWVQSIYPPNINKVEINISCLPPGIYYLRLWNEKNNQVGKIVKN